MSQSRVSSPLAFLGPRGTHVEVGDRNLGAPLEPMGPALRAHGRLDPLDPQDRLRVPLIGLGARLDGPGDLRLALSELYWLRERSREPSGQPSSSDAVPQQRVDETGARSDQDDADDGGADRADHGAARGELGRGDE